VKWHILNTSDRISCERLILFKIHITQNKIIMRYNAGRIDRALRFLISLIIIAAGFYYQSLWGLIGIIPLVSGLTGFCPLYSVFGISTCHYKVESSKTESLHT